MTLKNFYASLHEYKFINKPTALTLLNVGVLKDSSLPLDTDDNAFALRLT